MAPIPKHDEFSLSGNYGYSDSHGEEHEQGVPTMILWTHGGTNVSVEGSWDNWTTRYNY